MSRTKREHREIAEFFDRVAERLGAYTQDDCRARLCVAIIILSRDPGSAPGTYCKMVRVLESYLGEDPNRWADRFHDDYHTDRGRRRRIKVARAVAAKHRALGAPKR